jgi:hypothetical protein
LIARARRHHEAIGRAASSMRGSFFARLPLSEPMGWSQGHMQIFPRRSSMPGGAEAPAIRPYEVGEASWEPLPAGHIGTLTAGDLLQLCLIQQHDVAP